MMEVQARGPLIATMKLYLVLVPLLLTLSSCSAEGGFLGLGLFGGDDGGSGTGTESPLSPGILGQLESALTPPTDAPKPDVLGTVMAIMDVVSGKSSELPLEGIAALFGITATPIPSPGNGQPRWQPRSHSYPQQQGA